MQAGIDNGNVAPLYEKRSACDIVKFVAALLVVNGHMFLFGGYEGSMTGWMNLGACCVALFYFFSGYGLVRSYRSKGDAYIKGFLSHRLGRVLLPLLMAYVIALPVYAIFRGKIEWIRVFDTLAWGGPYLKFTWYVTEIIGVYLLYYLVIHLKIGFVSRLVVLSVVILIAMAVMMYAGLPVYWSVSLPGFIIGLLYAWYEDILRRTFSCGFVLTSLMICIIGWVMTWQWNLIGTPRLPEYRYALLAFFLSNIFFVLSVLGGLLMLGNNQNRKSGDRLRSLFTSSYEIYLIQFPMMIIAGAVTSVFWWKWLLTMLLVVVAGVGMHEVDKRILKICRI